jgi:hypothetical protein
MTEIDGSNQTDVEAIAESAIPLFDNQNKNRYLALRAVNLTVTEAARLLNLELSTINHWRRTDEEFKKADMEGMSVTREKLGNKFLSMEFTRNFHLALQKDFTVLMKSVLGETLSKEEHEYLLKIRPQYTPQQLGMIKQLAGEVAAPEGIDFTQLTLSIRREKEEIIIQRKDGG